MKKMTLIALFAFTSVCGFTGCGDEEYDIPPIDKEETEKAEAEVAKQMEEAMQQQMGGKKRKK